MGVVKRGRGKPFTLFAAGGQGEDLEARMRYADQVPGTKIGFGYESSGHFEALARVRREAERDAAKPGQSPVTTRWLKPSASQEEPGGSSASGPRSPLCSTGSHL